MGEVMSNRTYSLLRFVTVGLLSTGLMSVGSALAWADDRSIILDFIRHAQSIDNAAASSTRAARNAITQTGFSQAQTVGNAIATEYGKSRRHFCVR